MSVSKLHCQRIGAGPDLVLLHGWALHADIWMPVRDLLAAHFSLHLYDLPGHGRSAPVDEFTLESVCQQLHEEAPPQAFWLGWSLGGLIALEFAVRHPERVDKLFVVASSPRFVAIDNSYPGMQPEVLDNFAAELLEDHAATLKRFLSLVARGAEDKAVLRILRDAMTAAPTPTDIALQGGLAVLRDTDLRPRLEELLLPVMWLAGARDTLVPVTAMQQLTNEYSAMPLVVIEQAGHAPFVSHPQEFVDSVLEFLR